MQFGSSHLLRAADDPNALVAVPGMEGGGPLQGWLDVPNLTLLNLRYDVIPAQDVTAIITEYGMVPVTSVPVILREYQSEPTM